MCAFSFVCKDRPKQRFMREKVASSFGIYNLQELNRASNEIYKANLWAGPYNSHCCSACYGEGCHGHGSSEYQSFLLLQRFIAAAFLKSLSSLFLLSPHLMFLLYGHRCSHSSCCCSSSCCCCCCCCGCCCGGAVAAEDSFVVVAITVIAAVAAIAIDAKVGAATVAIAVAATVVAEMEAMQNTIIKNESSPGTPAIAGVDEPKLAHRYAGEDWSQEVHLRIWNCGSCELI